MSQLLTPEGGLMLPKGARPTGDIKSAIKQLEVIDPERFAPVEFRVLLRVMKVEDISPGGIWKLDSVLEKEIFGKCTATIVSMGSQAFTLSDGSPLPEKPKPGDTVILAKYSGLTLRDVEGNLYRLTNDKDVAAVLQ